MAQTNITEDDTGKPVVNSAGEKVGMITGVEAGTAYVDPDPGITESIRSKLGWSKVDQDDFALQGDRIDTITDDEVRLRSDL